MASCQRRTPQRFLIFSTVIVLAATTVIIATKASWAGKTTSGRRAEIPGTRASFPYAFGVTSTGRYPHDVLASGWQRAGRPTSTDLVVQVGLVLQDATSGFCGAVLRWERGLVVLEDRHGNKRTFALGAGFWYQGRPVVLKAPPRARSVPTRTASGSVLGPTGRAKTALASRIYVEGAPRRRTGGEDLGR
jgi:hypothetical protein